MPKVTLDMNTFKALASDTRLDILRTLDGKKMSLKDICKATKLNKATLHEHLIKLNEAGLVKKKEREGHKWVYYKLTWKGEGLLHPENTRIVVMFCTTFISLLLAVMLMVNFLQPIPVGIAETIDDTTYLYEIEEGGIPLLQRSYTTNYIGETDAKEKKVGNITIELQNNARPRNAIGLDYDDEDIIWVAPDQCPVLGVVTTSTENCNHDVAKASYDMDSPTYYSWCFSDYVAIDKNQALLNTLVDLNFSTIDANDSINETVEISDGDDNDSIEPSEENDSDDNTTDTLYDKGNGEGSTGFYPAVPQMIATVQDETFLQLAVVCLTFFAVLFTLSAWRLWVNRKPKL